MRKHFMMKLRHDPLLHDMDQFGLNVCTACLGPALQSSSVAHLLWSS